MVTNVAKANVSFSFYGTGVQIYGAKREQHGQFQITIDELVYTPQDGASVTPVFQTALFSTVALNEGYHTVTMTNLGAGLDIDFVCYYALLTMLPSSIVLLLAHMADARWADRGRTNGMD